MKRDIVAAWTVETVGAGCVVAGCFLLHVAVGLIAAGVWLMLAAQTIRSGR